LPVVVGVVARSAEEMQFHDCLIGWKRKLSKFSLLDFNRAENSSKFFGKIAVQMQFHDFF